MAETRFDNGLANPGISFVVAARYAPVLAQPAEGALYHPAPRQEDKALGAGWGSYYFHAQAQRRRRGGYQRSLVAGIGPEQLQVGGAGLGLGQDGSGSHRVLDAGCLYEYGQG